ncbi:putative bifunctional diguanylate cyclase/phosphodiesterase [Deinococcus actinosclerus]|nr:GGDEF domain-containing phosphodiesterase [Deinococcus actinosclerus]
MGAPPTVQADMEDGDATQPDLLAAWRRLLLWGLPAVQGAVVLALLLGRGDTWDRLVDPWLYLTISLVLTGSWLAVLSGRGSLRQITVLLTAGSALFLNAKLLLLAALLPDPGALLPELLETLVWLPAVITWTMLTDLARPVRRILNWMMAGVVTLSAVVAVRPLLIGHPLDMAALRALLQINLSALVSLYGASFFLRRSDLLGRAQGEQQVLRQLVYTDLLTGLPGRVRLSEQLRTLTGQGRPFAVLFVDVDAFKVVNDTLGHAVGDELLCVVAQELQRLAPQGSFVYRLSGDEFVVLLPQANDRAAQWEAQRLLQLVPVRPSLQVGMDITLSIGVSVYPDDATDAETLLRHADSAVYAVKRAGRRQVRRYQPQQDAATERFQVLARDLSLALSRRELSLHYQPVFCLREMRPVKAEALLRWRHPQLGMVSPGEFIPVAERVGLIAPIGAWVLRAACREALRWDDVTVSVNVSAVQLLQAEFPQVVRSALKDTGLSARRLELELTETAALYEDDRAAWVLHELRLLGVGLSIDDFGSGYSNLSRLRALPITGVKLDRSCIEGLPDGPGGAFARALLEAVMGLTRYLPLDLTVEGIESAAQLAALQELDCPLGQGHGLSRPLTDTEFLALLRGGSGTLPLHGRPAH